MNACAAAATPTRCASAASSLEQASLFSLSAFMSIQSRLQFSGKRFPVHQDLPPRPAFARKPSLHSELTCSSGLRLIFLPDILLPILFALKPHAPFDSDLAKTFEGQKKSENGAEVAPPSARSSGLKEIRAANLR
jgi:hypothetical protein